MKPESHDPPQEEEDREEPEAAGGKLWWMLGFPATINLPANHPKHRVSQRLVCDSPDKPTTRGGKYCACIGIAYRVIVLHRHNYYHMDRPVCRVTSCVDDDGLQKKCMEGSLWLVGGGNKFLIKGAEFTEILHPIYYLILHLP